MPDEVNAGLSGGEGSSLPLERLFRLFLEHSPVYIYFKDHDLRPVLLSRNFEEMLGRPMEQILGRTMEELFPPELARTMSEDDRRVIREDALIRVDEQLGDRYFTSIKFPVRQPGQPTFLAGLTLETTEQKLAQEALRRSEENYRRLFDAMTEGVAVHELVRDAQGKAVDFRILDVNRGFTRHTGKTREESVGRLASELIGPQALEALPLFTSVAEGGAPIQFEGHFAQLDRYFQVRASSTRPGTFVTFVEDLTEQIRSREEKQRLEAEYQHMQTLESLGSLAGGVAHDMNNVLQAIQGMAAVLREKCAGHSELLPGLDLILDASQRGGDLVRNLTEFVRKGLPEPVGVDLNRLVQREVDLLRRTTLQRIDVQLELAEDLPEILGDPSAIGSALMNLAVNAVDAMPVRGVLRFRTRRTREGGGEIEVEDNGEGMAPEVLARALEPFYTTKSVGKGTGLGLSNVYGTMKAHGGSMEIQSRVGQGTRVVLRFPAVGPREAPTAGVAEGAIRTGGQAPSLKMHLIDDDELIRESFPEFVELLGHRVVAVDHEGEAGLCRVAAGLEADVVVLDHNMPGLSGLETLKRLRALRPELPVLFCTGHLDDAVRRVLDRWTGVRVLMKPYTLQAIGEALLGLPGLES